jgi:hypothetical protein
MVWNFVWGATRSRTGPEVCHPCAELERWAALGEVNRIYFRLLENPEVCKLLAVELSRPINVRVMRRETRIGDHVIAVVGYELLPDCGAVWIAKECELSVLSSAGFDPNGRSLDASSCAAAIEEWLQKPLRSLRSWSRDIDMGNACMAIALALVRMRRVQRMVPTRVFASRHYAVKRYGTSVFAEVVFVHPAVSGAIDCILDRAPLTYGNRAPAIVFRIDYGNSGRTDVQFWENSGEELTGW